MSRKIKFDSNNFNKHTDKGMKLLEKSVKEVGVIESITTDKKGDIVSGNARKEIFDKMGFKPKFIELKDDEYPVIQTDLDGEKRIRAAILANTVALENINLDTVKIEETGIDLEEVGIEVFDGGDIDLDKFFEEADNDDSSQKNKIVLEYTQEDYEKVCDAFDALEGSREEIVWRLLKL